MVKMEKRINAKLEAISNNAANDGRLPISAGDCPS
jgi:hypothetical protein